MWTTSDRNRRLAERDFWAIRQDINDYGLQWGRMQELTALFSWTGYDKYRTRYQAVRRRRVIVGLAHRLRCSGGWHLDRIIVGDAFASSSSSGVVLHSAHHGVAAPLASLLMAFKWIVVIEPGDWNIAELLQHRCRWSWSWPCGANELFDLADQGNIGISRWLAASVLTGRSTSLVRFS